MTRRIGNQDISERLQMAASVYLHDPLRAQSLAEEAVRLADTPLEATQGRFMLGRALVQRGEYRSAIVPLREALAMTMPGESLGAALQLELGNAHANLGEVEAAFEAHARAHQAYRRLDEPIGLARVLHNVGSGFREIHDFDRAETHLHQALELFCKHQDVSGEAMALVTLGLVANERQDPRLALDRLQAGLHRAIQAHDVRQQALALVNLGWGSQLNGDVPVGHSLMLRTLELARSIQSRHYEGLALAGLANACFALGDVQSALTHLNQALGLFEALGVIRGELIVHQGLAQALETVGDTAGALRHYKQFHALERRVLAGQAEQAVRIIGARFEADVARQATRNLEEAYARLREQAEQLDRLSREDPLTGLSNRRHLDETLRVLFDHAKRLDLPLCVILADIDNFKSINDRCSHAVGDQVLRQVALLIREAARSTDLLARFGGEEFVLALEGAQETRALEIAERIRHQVEHHHWTALHPELAVTISLGVADREQLEHHEHLLDVADARLYAAKRAGKNRVQGAEGADQSP